MLRANVFHRINGLEVEIKELEALNKKDYLQCLRLEKSVKTLKYLKVFLYMLENKIERPFTRIKIFIYKDKVRDIVESIERKQIELKNLNSLTDSQIKLEQKTTYWHKNDKGEYIINYVNDILGPRKRTIESSIAYHKEQLHKESNMLEFYKDKLESYIKP